MYNILLCDDEQIVIDSLTFILNKNFEGQISIFSANSGSEAINIAGSRQIDIIFMDINMPGISGLETISCILNLKPETVIMILSAFDSFEYAQQAINLGAFKYITKPVNRNVVVQNVRSAMNAVDSRRSKSIEDDELQKKLDLVSPMIENDFFYSCIFNKNENDDILTYLDYFNFQETDFYVAVIEFEKITKENQNELYNKTRELIHKREKCLVSALIVNRIILFFPVEDDIQFNEFDNLMKLISLNVTRDFKWGKSRIFTNLDEMKQYYSEALLQLSDTPTEDLQNSALKPIKNSSANLQQRLLSRLKLGDSAQLQFLTDSYGKALSNEGLTLDEIKNEFFELLVNARLITKEIAGKTPSENKSDTFSILNSFSTEEQILHFCKQKLIEHSEYISGIINKTENPTIKKVLQFIDKNLNSNISLELAAQNAGINPFYLSKLFREQTGMNFVNFISDKRLEKAKELIKSSNLSIKEITAETGFNDQNYFSKLFKNKYGISPSEFRKNYENN